MCVKLINIGVSALFLNDIFRAFGLIMTRRIIPFLIRFFVQYCQILSIDTYIRICYDNKKQALYLRELKWILTISFA